MYFNEICRICLKSSDVLLNIFSDMDSIMISSKIMTITKLDVYPNDGLPASICTMCDKKLEECVDFINLCKKSDCNLKNIINETTEENIGKKSSFITKNHICKLTPKIRSIINENETDKEVEIKDNKILIEEYRDLCKQRRLPQKQQCFTCGKIMSSRFRLKTHLATHLKEKPHSCPHCQKKFTIIENLNSHIRIHTGEKPYSCATCGETFAQSSALIVHKRKHTGETPYQCELCPRSFQTLANFKYHVSVHTGERKYDCSLCGRAFITKSDLKQHIVTHSGEKPHVCCVCGMSFSRASNLKRHMEYLHTKKKYITCEHCSSKFIRKCDLAKHEKIHNNKPKKF